MKLLPFPPLLLALLFTAVAVRAQAPVDQYYEDARSRFEARDYNAAMIQLKNALAIDDQHMPSLVLLGELYLYRGEAPAAEQAFSEALVLGADPALVELRLAESLMLQRDFQGIVDALDPDAFRGAARADRLGYLALAHDGLGETERADALLQQALIEFPHARMPLIARIQAALGAGDPDTAGELSDGLVRRYPDDARSWALRAAALSALSRPGDALDAYRRSLELNPALPTTRMGYAALLLVDGRDQQALDIMQALVKERPDNPRAAYLLARIREARGDRDGALEAYASCANLLSNMDAELLDEDAQLTSMVAVSHLRLGEAARAIEYLRTYQRGNPAELDTGRLLATLLLEGDSPAAAVDIIDPLLRAHPGDAGLQRLQGRALFATGDLPGAAAAWQRVAELEGDSAAVEARIAMIRLAAEPDSFRAETMEKLLSRPDAPLQDALALGLIYQQQGHLDSAVVVGRLLVERAPDQPRYHEFLSRSLPNGGDLDAARARARSGLDAHPDDVPLILVAAEVATAAGQYDAAGAQLAEVLEQAPDNLPLLLQAARVERLREAPSSALALLRRAESVDPDSLEVARMRFQLELEAGDTAAAEATARRIVYRNADGMEGRFLLGRALHAAGRREELRTNYRVIARGHPAEPAILYRLAQEQARSGLLADARESLETVIALDPSGIGYQRDLVRVLVALGESDIARQQVRSMLAAFPQSAVPHALSADLFDRQGRHREAAAAYAIAASRDAANRQYALGLSRALAESGDAKGADDVLQRWLQRFPDDALMLFARSELTMAQGDWVAAESQLLGLLRKQPDDPVLLNNLAFAQQAQGKARALDHARRAHALAPGSPQINDTLGWILVQQGQPEQALAFLRQAVERAAAKPAYRYHLAVALHALGRRAEAQDELLAALRDGDGFSESADARRLLATLQ